MSFLSPPPAGEVEDLLGILHPALEEEDPAYRPADSAGRPGGLVLLDPAVPTLVLPDIHARPLFVRAALDAELPGVGGRAEDAVREGRAQLVCVGDYFHAEGRAARRWRAAYEEYLEGYARSPAMDAEMAEGLAVIDVLGRLKAASPRFVHLLKGNHENVADEEGGGNHRFSKYAYESAMVADYVRSRYGISVLMGLRAFEKALPLVAVGSRFAISHAEPARAFPRGRIIGYREDPEVVYGLTWTDDGAAEEGGVDAMLDELIDPALREGAIWFGGHRPVRGLYNLRAGGSYAQIHNPRRSVVAILPPDRPPDPGTDVVDLGETQDSHDE